MKVAIRRVGLASLARMGCLLGVVAAFLPSLLCGLLGLGLMVRAYAWLQQVQGVSIAMGGFRIATFDLVEMMGLEGVMQALQVVTSASWAVLFLGVLALSLLAGLFLALIALAVGLAYNGLAGATGGIVVELRALPAAKPPPGEEPPVA
jgi:uncharacterized membrane protein